MPRQVAAGLVMVRGDEVLLAHPGGPYFRRRDAGVWSIPKGLAEPGEELLAAARRELEEETGYAPPTDERAYVDLGVAKQSKKDVHAWAFRLRGGWDPAELVSNEFELEWPPKSGTMQRFPEVDRAAFFPLEVAREKAVKAQVVLLERALERLPPE
ncbi:MAG TPA: NUDIX domain-containing protein [Polyangiaceae bacterium LLY-WYZ-15_(1-7)]|nr:NUDIX hydrolase [Myxococcales bacterium]MAT28464.1 NUDIX hydrolase [Sandaracinus sp.]HJK92666.1 NUDIX domain-containing protein [Polyangiaceae bacterium LLY-WYZ-15_(1-7)]MBJ74111.1 NUDIX hydrolase [Sandaracinus sp.]HJL04199.1 NUDIX domain-containing protein [Polyangiaceae bacterium LLY-WYZ-15_(1-7)]